MAVLKHNVFLFRNYPAGPVVAVHAGEEVPDWAVSQLAGATHLFEEGSTPVVVSEPAAGPLPEPKVVSEPETTELAVPSLKASAPTWRAFAKNIGVEVAPKATRNEIVETVRLARPDLLIEEEEV